MVQENYNLKKIAIWLVVIVVALLAIFKIYNYLTTGKIIATTSTPSNYLKIERLGGKAYSKQEQHKVSARVKAGSYVVTVYNRYGTFGKSQTVTVAARKTVRVKLDPPPTVNPEPVYGSSTGNVAVDNSKLLFTDGSDHLIQIDAGGINTLFPNYSIKSISWLNPGVGIMQTNTNDLYVINHGALSPLSLPFQASGNQFLGYDIAENGDVYVNNGPDIYVGSLNGGFKKIYTAGTSSLSLTAGTSKVAVVEGKSGASIGTLDLIDDTGKIVKKSVPVTQASWAPGDKYIVVSGEGVNHIYDSSLNSVGSAPLNSSAAFAWLSGSELLYNNGSQLWKYDLPTKQSQKITALAAGENITGIYPTPDSSYIYFSDNNTEKTQLFRVPMKGQTENRSMNSLAIIMPESIGVCSLNYANFINPLITIHYPSGSVDPKSCINTAQNELKSYGLNPDKFTYPTIPVVSSY